MLKYKCIRKAVQFFFRVSLRNNGELEIKLPNSESEISPPSSAEAKSTQISPNSSWKSDNFIIIHVFHLYILFYFMCSLPKHNEKQ
jgi:hypothetical protein